MKITIEKDFAKHVSSESLCGAYLLFGSQTFLIKNYRDTLVKKAVGSLDDQMNLHRFEEDSFDLAAFNDAVEALPFFAEHRCVTLDLHGERLDKATAESIGKILSDVPNTTTVVVCFPGENVKKEVFNPISKACDKSGCTVELKERTKSDMLRFLRSKASKGGCNLSGEVGGYLMERCGMDMLRLSGEVEKLCAFVEQGDITKAHVDEITAPVLSARVFDLSKAVLNGQTDKAMHILDSLKRQKEPAPMVLSVLCGAFSDLYRGDAVRRQGVFVGNAAVELHYPKNREFALKNAMSDCQKVPNHLFLPVLDILATADKRSKSTGGDPWMILEEAVLRLFVVLGRG